MNTLLTAHLMLCSLFAFWGCFAGENNLIGTASTGIMGSAQTVIVHSDPDEHHSPYAHQASSPVSPNPPSATVGYASQPPPAQPLSCQPPPYMGRHTTYNPQPQQATVHPPSYNQHMMSYHDVGFPHQGQDDGYFSQQSTLEARHHPVLSQSQLQSIV